MTKSRLSPKMTGLLAASLTATCWSFLAIFIKIALQSADAYTIAWYRMISAFFLLSAYLLTSGRSSLLKTIFSPKPQLVACGILLAFNYLGFMKGVELTSPANAQIFIQLGPMLLALSGILFFSEKLTLPQWGGLSLCVLGFAIFFRDKYHFSQGVGGAGKETYLVGQIWILMAAITWAVFGVFQKKLLQQKVNPHQINLFLYALSSLLFIPLVDWGQLLTLSFSEHLLFFFLGANTLFAYSSLSVALKYLPATVVSPLLSLNPLATLALIAILEFLQFDILPADPISQLGYLGAIMAIFGVVTVLGMGRRKSQ